MFWCHLVILLFWSSWHYHTERASQRCLAEPVHWEADGIVSERFLIVFSSNLLKLSAEMEKNSNKLVLPVFYFTILFISLSLFSVQLMHVCFCLETGFNGGHGHMTRMDVCDHEGHEDSALNIAHYRKFILTKFCTVKQTLVCLLLLHYMGFWLLFKVSCVIELE